MKEGLLRKRILAITNPLRVKMYFLCLKRVYNLSELKQELGLSYKSIWQHAKVLENAEMVEKKVVITAKAKEGQIKSIPLNPESLVYRVLRELEREHRGKA